MAARALARVRAVYWPGDAMFDFDAVSYMAWLRRRGLQVREDRIWAAVGTARPGFGWKLHVSAVQAQALETLEAVLDLLEHTGTPFKCARDETVLAELNEGDFGVTQIGKFMTIYPADDAACRQLGLALADRTAALGGPRVITDLHLGGAVYTRYGAFAPRFARNRLGQLEPERNPDAEYQTPFRAPEGVPNPFADLMSPVGPDAPEADKAGVFGPGFKLLKPISVQPKGNVYLALDVRDQACVAGAIVKTGRAHCMSDSLGRDIRDRLTHQHSLLTALAGHVPVPSPLALFDAGEHRALAMTHVDGRDIGDRPATPYHRLNPTEQTDILSDLIALCRTLARLHRAGYVHRDISPRNVRINPAGQAVLVDLEMAWSCSDPSPPFESGTPGFLSPQQRARCALDPSDDLYSVGCLALNLITGMDPRRLPMPVDRAARLQAWSALSAAPMALLALCADLTETERADRPDAVQAAARLAEIAQRPQSAPPGRAWPSADMGAVLQGGAAWLLEGGLRDAGSGFPLSLEIEETHNPGAVAKAQSYRLYRSASRGVAGVVYALGRLARAGVSMDGAAAFADRATDWLLAHAPTPDDQMPGLHYGEAGVAVALCEALRAKLIAPGDWLAPYLDEALGGPLDWPDLTHGAAGQALAAHIVADTLDERRWADKAAPAIAYLLERQDPDGAWRAPAGGGITEGTAYTGFAHGAAGCVHVLARHAALTGDSQEFEAAERGAAWLDGWGEDAGAGRSWAISPDDTDRWHWWCHGGPGIALAMLSLFQVSHEARWRARAQAAFEALPDDPLGPNLSQCHGLAGLGEMYLTAHAVLGEARWRDRAEMIASRLIALARTDEAGRVSWLVENPSHATADLMIGTAGVLHFLSRMNAPDALAWSMPLDLPPHPVSGGLS